MLKKIIFMQVFIMVLLNMLKKMIDKGFNFVSIGADQEP